MKNRSLAHLSDQTLECAFAALLGQERTTVATLLLYIAEIDERKLYAAEAYPSMSAYCVGKFRLSADSTAKRIQAARAAGRFPAIFHALEDGRLHLSAVVMLVPHLTEENAASLIAGATHKTKAEIEQLLAARFPRPDVPTRVRPVVAGPAAHPHGEHAPGHVGDELMLVPETAREVRSTVKPLAPERFALQMTIDQQTHDKLRRAQELLGHQVPSGDVAQVFDRGLDALIHDLEKQKFAATSKPRRHATRPTSSERHVPAGVRRVVWARDGGRCTFVSASGHRCESRTRLEFDHVVPVARGGRATVANIRLRCRAHNQLEAERTFGAGFMKSKRRAASEARAAATRVRTAASIARTEAAASTPDVSDVIPSLRKLDVRAEEARLAAACCETIPDAPLEQRVRVALSFLGAGTARRGRAGDGAEVTASSA